MALSAPTDDGDVSSTNVAKPRKATNLADSVVSEPSKTSHTASHYNSIPRSRPALTTSMPSETSPPSSPTAPDLPTPDRSMLLPEKPKHPFHAPAPHGMISKITPEALNKEMLEAIGGVGPDGQTRQYKINAPPAGRPIRIYADGAFALAASVASVDFYTARCTGVYDLFHYAHAVCLSLLKHHSLLLTLPNSFN